MTVNIDSADREALSHSPFWNRRMVPFMAAAVGFLFLSFILVAVFAWFYTDAAAQAARIRELGARLVAQEPAQPSAALAGRVVYVRGAAVGPAAQDADTQISFPGAVAVERTKEIYRGGRTEGWRLDDISVLPAPALRIGGWALNEAALAAAPEALTPLRPGADFRPPAGLLLSPTESMGVYADNGKRALTDDPAHRRSAGDRRMTYRGLAPGAVSLIALADRTGEKLEPLNLDGVKVALLATGDVAAADLIGAATSQAYAVKLKTVLATLAVAWGLFVIPAAWTTLGRWSKFAAAPLAGAAATLAAGMAAAPFGVAAAYLAGQIAAAAYLAAMAFYARRRPAQP